MSATEYAMPPLKPRRVGSEDILQVAVWRTLKFVLPGDAVAFSIENKNSGVRAAQARRARGIMPGVPDMLVLWPEAGGAFIELKTETGRLEASQKVMIPRIERAGFRVGICRSIDEVLRFLRDAGCPLRCTVP